MKLNARQKCKATQAEKMALRLHFIYTDINECKHNVYTNVFMHNVYRLFKRTNCVPSFAAIAKCNAKNELWIVFQWKFKNGIRNDEFKMKDE